MDRVIAEKATRDLGPDAGLVAGTVEKDQIGSIPGPPDDHRSARRFELDPLEPELFELHAAEPLGEHDRVVVGVRAQDRDDEDQQPQNDRQELQNDAAFHEEPPGKALGRIRKAAPAWL